MNLDFEQAIVPSTAPGEVDLVHRPVSWALPGWQAYYGAIPTDHVWHNDMSLGGTAIILFGPHFYPSTILEGNYTVFLGAGWMLQDGEFKPVDASIAQTGRIPSDAASLRFKIGIPRPALRAEEFEVLVDGNTLAPVVLGQFPTYTLFGADIRDYAGMIVELKFTAHYTPPLGNAVFLDSIEFSPDPIPEPRGLALLAVGVVLLLRGDWRHTRRR